MSRALLLLGLAGCGIALAEPPAPTPPAREPLSLDELAAGYVFQLDGTLSNAARPDLGPAPTIGFELAIELDSTWPGRRLDTEPHFALARAFDHAGDSWTALCEMRGRSRSADDREVLSYLGTWCAMRTSATAVEDLIPLVSARTHGLAEAARDDLAAILADHDPPTDAIAWLDRHRALTPEVLDALATSYAASAQHDEARRVLEYVRATDPDPAPDHTCRRLQHEAAVSDAATRAQIDRDLLTMPASDPTCAKIAAPLRCKRELERTHDVASCNGRALDAAVALDLGRCRPYLKQHPKAEPAVTLLALRQHWPASRVGSCHWQQIGEVASRSLAVPGAEQLAIAALENGIIDSDCDAHSRASIAMVARAITKHSPTHGGANVTLVSSTADLCRGFRPQ